MDGRMDGQSGDYMLPAKGNSKRDCYIDSVKHIDL